MALPGGADMVVTPAKTGVAAAVPDSLFDALWTRYQANREVSKATPYVAEAEHFARRALQNIALSYLMLSGKPQVLAAALSQL